MKWILFLLLLTPLIMQSQDDISGDWYHVSTGRLVHMSIRDDSISWSDKTFQFQDREGKQGMESIFRIFNTGNVFGIVHKNNDTSDQVPYSLTVLQQGKDLRYLDLLMQCGDGSYQDTASMRKYFSACDLSDKMRMRLYSRATIDSFMTLKPVNGITKNDLGKIKRSFKKKADLLIKEFGEDKLLWIAPIIFQQVLTELLLGHGYNPMITEEQAENLFDFNFF